MPESTSTGIEIRVVDHEEFVGFDVNHYAFGATPSVRNLDDARKRIPYLADATAIAAFEGGKPQATAMIHSMTQHVRGKILSMGGIGGVASLPAGRRKGTVRKLMASSLGIMRERGEYVSTLYPFRDSFYERLGYAGFPKPRYAKIAPEALGPLVRMPKPGDVEQMPMSEGFDAWRGFLEAYQRDHHGFALKALSNAVGTRDHNVAWIAFVREHGEITGAMTFRITGYGGSLHAETFYYRTSAARYQLLDWIGRHVDQVKDAWIRLGPREFPELWYQDLNAEISTTFEHAWPAPMARIISVAELGGLEAGDGRITVDLVDELCPWNTATWTLTGSGDRLAAEPGGTPECRITIQGLSALVYVGHDPADFVYRGWGDPNAGAQATLRALFPPAFPVLHEQF
jgi:predicted acetyltransferase